MWALLGRHQSRADLKKADCTHSLFLPPGETSLRKKKRKKQSRGFSLIVERYECTAKEAENIESQSQISCGGKAPLVSLLQVLL